MRKSSCYGNKLYVNDRALCVVGNKIDLEGHQRLQQKRYANRQLKLSLEGAEEASPSRKRPEVVPNPSQGKRKPLKLNVKEYQNHQVCNQQLRRIYATVEAGDFERILRNLQACDEFRKRRDKNRADAVIAKIKPTEVYEQFYGQHLDHLKSLITKS